MPLGRRFGTPQARARPPAPGSSVGRQIGPMAMDARNLPPSSMTGGATMAADEQEMWKARTRSPVPKRLLATGFNPWVMALVRKDA